MEFPPSQEARLQYHLSQVLGYPIPLSHQEVPTPYNNRLVDPAQATGGKNCSLAKTARGSRLPQTTTHTKKTLASALPCSSEPYAAAGQISITPWRTPTKLTGDPDLPLHDTPSEAICASCITFHEMSTLLQRSKFIDFSIVIVASSSIGAGDDHETNAVCFGRRANSKYFFVAEKFKCCSI